ncbi:MAG: hypothetical protein ACR2MK_01730 [Solirubrobacteraceae bacterium]
MGSPRAIAGAREVLTLGFDGSALELLTGSSPSGLDCCSATQAVRITAGGVVARPQPLVGGLAGATLGQLVTLADGRMVASVATERGVWALQSLSGGRFAAQRRLTSAGQTPTSLTATWLGGESSVLAWTAASGPAGYADPRAIFYSLGSKQGGPRRAHTLLRVPAGHRIDELAVVRRGSGATATWVEGSYDGRGSYHSLVRAADFGPRPGVRALSTGGLADGLSSAADAAGAQAVAFKTCNGEGACTVQVATRGPSSRFGAAASLGRIDASQSPAVTVGRRGQVLVGWVRSGQPVAVVGTAGSGHFGSVRVLSPSVYALDMTVAFGPGRQALAAWTQGTLNPSVVGASYSGP